MSKQAKRARFYAKARSEAVSRRIVRQHGHKPGFVGVVTSMTITFDGPDGAKRQYTCAPGALFRADSTLVLRSADHLPGAREMVRPAPDAAAP